MQEYSNPEESRGKQVESVMGQCGKFEFNVLVDGKPMKMLKNGKQLP